MAFVSSFLPSTQVSSSSRLVPAISPRQRKAAPCGISMTVTKTSQYDVLTTMTTIVEDTGDIEQIAKHQPHSATTNPTLVATAADDERYKDLLNEAVSYAREHTSNREDMLALTRNKLFTLFGAKILSYVPGDVSTEVDARLSFDAAAQIDVARQIISMYEEVGVDRERVLIKLATTWEGIEACRQLQNEGIRTNMTLLFSLPQAAAAAEANAYLISPFVGRILDWFKKAEGVDSYPAPEDPGVKSVRSIYNYYKCLGYDTIVMGASFRNKGEILELAGCDRLTIAPKFISDLKDNFDPIERKLSPPGNDQCVTMDKLELDESRFRWMMNEDAMATEKLAHGIRSFAKDLEKLDIKLNSLIDA